MREILGGTRDGQAADLGAASVVDADVDVGMDADADVGA